MKVFPLFVILAGFLQLDQSADHVIIESSIAGHRNRGWVKHSWASESRPMPPASAFRHPVSQYGTGAFRYRTGSSYPDTGQVPASAFLFIPVPDWLDAGQSDIPALIKKSTPRTSTLQTEGSGKWYTKNFHGRLVLVLLVLYDVEKSNAIAGMPDCWRKFSPASALYWQSTSSVWHRHSGIRVSPVPLVTY
jgi:hypothetical protein